VRGGGGGASGGRAAAAGSAGFSAASRQLPLAPGAAAGLSANPTPPHPDLLLLNLAVRFAVAVTAAPGAGLALMMATDALAVKGVFQFRSVFLRPMTGGATGGWFDPRMVTGLAGDFQLLMQGVGEAGLAHAGREGHCCRP